MAVDIDQRGGNIVLTMPNASVVDELLQQLDVTDFATPVSLIDIFEQGSAAVIEVQPTGAFDYLAYQADGRFILEVKPVAQGRGPATAGGWNLVV